MNIAALIAGTDLDGSQRAAIADLIKVKSQGDEAATGPRIAVLDHLIRTEIELARASTPIRPATERLAEADKLFRHLVKGVVEQSAS